MSRMLGGSEAVFSATARLAHKIEQLGLIDVNHVFLFVDEKVYFVYCAGMLMALEGLRLPCLRHAVAIECGREDVLQHNVKDADAKLGHPTVVATNGGRSSPDLSARFVSRTEYCEWENSSWFRSLRQTSMDELIFSDVANSQPLGSRFSRE